MPDVGTEERSSGPAASHVSTAEWQSFEIRMRRRRAQRCLLRAGVAIDAGFLEDARAALDEARALHAPSEEIERIEALLAAAVVAAEQPVRRMRWKPLAVAAAVVVAVSVFGLGTRQRQPPAPLPAAQAAGSDSPQPAEKTEPPTVQNVPVQFSEVLAVPTAGIAPDPAESPDRNTRERAPELDPPSIASTTDAAPASASAPRVPEPPPVLVAATSSLPLAAAEPPVAPPPPPPAPAEVRPREAGPAERVAPSMTAVPGLTAAPPPRDESAEVRAILERYESAYTRLDPSLARAVWPGVNENALARAFSSLESQEVSLGRCEVSVSGATARATCTGTAKWTPKVGGGGARTEARRWTFDLRRAGEGWQIERALAR